MSQESFSQELAKSARPVTQKLFRDGIRYASQAEISCSLALQKYCDWKPIEGSTYQVAIGHSKTCDFVIQDTFVEFHPIIFSRELSKPVYRSLKDALKGLRDQHRRVMKEVWRSYLLEEYANKRAWTMRLSDDPKVRDADLIVVTCPTSFYDEILKQFAKRKLPRRCEFIKMFKNSNFKE